MIKRRRSNGYGDGQGIINSPFYAPLTTSINASRGPGGTTGTYTNASVLGTRTFTDYNTVVKAVSLCGWVPSLIICGCAPGVDTLGIQFAAQFNLPVEKFPAEWDKYGKSAGRIRNVQMGDVADGNIGSFLSNL